MVEDVGTFISNHIPDAQLRGRNYFCVCLWCDGGEKREKTMVIDSDTGKFTCNRKNNCGVNGNLFTIKEKLGIQTTPKHFYRPKAEYKPIKKTLPIVKYVEMPFFTQRGINQNTIKNFKVYESKYNNQKAYCFPYFYQGKLANIKYRLKDKKFAQEKDNYSTLWNISNIDYTKKLYIVEGEMDCMSMWQNGMTNVVSVPSGVSNLNWIDNNWEELERLSTIVLALDNDVAGNEAVEKISKRLGKHRCRRMIFTGFKDANEACMGGRENNLYEVIEEEDMKPELIAQPLDFLKQGLARMNNPDYAKGFESAFNLSFNNKKFEGYRKGETTIWTGAEGRGKTTMVFNEMCHQMVFNNCKICIASLETDPSSWMQKIIKQLKGDEISPKDFENLLIYLQDKMSIVNYKGSINPDDLFECLEYSARRFGATHFVIDNLMRINLDLRDGYKGHKDFINKLTAFSQEFGVHTHLICHQKKLDEQKRFAKPRVSGILGSSELANAVDNVFLIHRIDDEENANHDEKFNAILKIGKQREGGHIFKKFLHFHIKNETFNESQEADLNKFMNRILGRC